MNRYLEIIELRTSGRNREKLESVLEELIAGSKANSEQEQIQVYNSLLIESDFCIQLHFQAENSNREGSPSGLRMVEALKEYGLIHHNIWCEMPFRPFKANQGVEDLERQTKE